MVDQPGYGTNRTYLLDNIKLTGSLKVVNSEEIQHFYRKKRLSAAQIANQLGVSKTAVLGVLHRSGVRDGKKGRSTDPTNYRNNSPPYGYKVQNGKLVINKAELRICRAIVELRGRQGLSTTEVAKELTKKGFRNRGGRTVWNPHTILNIFNRWNKKI